jgi:hypothetical protein
MRNVFVFILSLILCNKLTAQKTGLYETINYRIAMENGAHNRDGKPNRNY